MLKGREDLFHPSVMNIVLLVPNDCLHILKYVGVQSWKAMHLPTLDIRVKQMGNRTSVVATLL